MRPEAAAHRRRLSSWLSPLARARRWLWAGLWAGLSGCVTLPQPTPEDAVRGAVRWPGLSVAALAQGRQVYSERCSGCHRLYLPESHTAEKWARVVWKMAPRAHLTVEERALIEQFLTTLSTRPPGPP